MQDMNEKEKMLDLYKRQLLTIKHTLAKCYIKKCQLEENIERIEYELLKKIENETK